jgi:hypothetical protein
MTGRNAEQTTIILKCSVNEKAVRMLPRSIRLRIRSRVMDCVQSGMNARVLQEVEKF